MSDQNRPYRRRRTGALRAFVSILIAAAIILLALSTVLGSPEWLDLATTVLPSGLPSPIVVEPAAPLTEPAPPAVSEAPTESPTPFPTSSLFDREALQQEMLDLINDDRAAAGLDPVAWDETAALAAQAHAIDMARHGYLSHWDREGHDPFYRYSQMGGLDTAQENVYLFWQRYDDGSPVPVDDWSRVVRDAQVQLMASPGHRDNILAPSHTHVGIGIAYNPETGDVRIAQLFVDDYVDLEALPLEVSVAEEIQISGLLHPGASQPLLNLAYEPFPEPMTVEALNQTGAFASETEAYDALPLPVENGRFGRSVHLGYEGRPGLYHVRVWVETEHGTVLASNVVIEVR
jgi:uncharacterized protein YkwD